MPDEQERMRVANLLVGELWESGPWVPPALFEAIIASGDLVVESLVGLLTADTDDEPVTFYGAFHAALLLGRLGAVDAIPVLIQEMRQYEDPEMLEAMAQGLAALGAPALEPALELVTDRALVWMQRGLACEAAMGAARGDPDLVERVREVFRDELEGLLARKDDLTDDEVMVVSELVSDLAELRDPAGRPLIGAAFAADIVDLSFVDPKEVEALYESRVEPERRANLAEFFDTYPQRYDAHVAQLGYYLRIAKDLPVPGRNDPCWCGSGKKYKQCHWAQDQKARPVELPF